MFFDLSIIKGKTVFDLIRSDPNECIRIVRDAYLAHAEGQSVNPDSYFLRFPDRPDCRIIALPAFVGNGVCVAGLKWISSYPGNVQRGFPRASAVLVLNDYDTGYPFAILESSIISASHTAASRPGASSPTTCTPIVPRAIGPSSARPRACEPGRYRLSVPCRAPARP